MNEFGMEKKDRNCSNCAFQELFKYCDSDKEEMMRCWEHPDVCDHAFVQTVSKGKNFVCCEHKTREEDGREKLAEAVWSLKSARKSVKWVIAEYPELKVKAETILEKNIWHRQSEEDIYDAFNDWSLHEFACIMKDGTVQKFTGILDECYDGSINKHVDCGVDGFECDDIEYWLEFPEKN